MNHEQSVARQSVEQYLLGELSGADRADFESHLFECEECAEEVRIGFCLIENAKAVFHEEARPEPRVLVNTRWTRWMRSAAAVPAAAGLAVVAIAAYQNLVVLPSLRAQIAHLNRPQAWESSLVIAPLSRGEAPSIAVSPGASFIPLSLVVGAVPSAERYECDVRSDSGQSLWKIPIATLRPDEELHLLIPASKVSAGYYQAVLIAMTGPNSAEIDRYHFAVRTQ